MKLTDKQILVTGGTGFIGTNFVYYWLDTGTPKPHRFHHVSTDEVYGSLAPEDPPFTETTPYAPNSPYAASKPPKSVANHILKAYYC